jgi:hypothetical protein
MQNEKLHNVYASPFIIRVIKSRGMIWAGHVAVFSLENLKETGYSGDPGVDGKIILKGTLRK